jgi:hypothetical protein
MQTFSAFFAVFFLTMGDQDKFLDILFRKQKYQEFTGQILFF